MTFAATWLEEVRAIAADVQPGAIEDLVDELSLARARRGRVFVLGIGGSAANAAHAVNDLRVRCRIEAYAPTDAPAELLARCNDEPHGWELMFVNWLRGSRCAFSDVVLVLSVSGKSQPLWEAARYAKTVGAEVIGILGTEDSLIGACCSAKVVIPCPNEEHRAGHSETFQASIWHALVAHPRLA